LELISKQLQKDLSFNRYDLIIKEIIEELCQCFQTSISLMNFTSPIQSASSEATLVGRRFLRSVAYLCAKQTINLPIPISNNYSKESVFVWQSRTMKKHQSLDLSTIHEASFESDKEIDHHPITSDNKIQSQIIVKRQPLREIDINSFNNEEREIEYEKIRYQNSIVFPLVSDGDKENLPVITKKRSMISTKNEPPNKKHKKTPEADY